MEKLDNHMQKLKWSSSLTPFTKINAKWVKSINIRPKATKVLEENRGKLLNIGLGNNGLDMT